MQPDLIQTPTGWLAVTPRNSRRNVGVLAADPDAARAKFAASWAAWERLKELPEPTILMNEKPATQPTQPKRPDAKPIQDTGAVARGLPA
jgi:hypothetical protein